MRLQNSAEVSTAWNSLSSKIQGESKTLWDIASSFTIRTRLLNRRCNIEKNRKENYYILVSSLWVYSLFPWMPLGHLEWIPHPQKVSLIRWDLLVGLWPYLGSTLLLLQLLAQAIGGVWRQELWISEWKVFGNTLDSKSWWYVRRCREEITATLSFCMQIAVSFALSILLAQESYIHYLLSFQTNLEWNTAECTRQVQGNYVNGGFPWWMLQAAEPWVTHLNSTLCNS